MKIIITLDETTDVANLVAMKFAADRFLSVTPVETKVVQQKNGFQILTYLTVKFQNTSGEQ